MCGISGIFSQTNGLDARLIRDMNDALRHRGPDDESFLAVDLSGKLATSERLFGPDSSVTAAQKDVRQFVRPVSLFLGHRRLSILDLSSAGRQPMTRDEKTWITFNGEIYNYIELRQELTALGYGFETRTDTEVILAAYDAWGEACVTRFNGDWAFALLDLDRRTLFLSRDRYGIKPLFFADWQGGVAFASEMKSLFALPGMDVRLNPDVLGEYLLFTLSDHRRETTFARICQLLPGENLTVHLSSGEKKFVRYYTLPTRPPLRPYSEKVVRSVVDELRSLLFDSVRIRLRADVPVGTGLSGGLDSSAIAAIIAILRKGDETPQHVFTASFPGMPIDEARHADQVSRRYGLKSHIVYPDLQGFERSLHRLFYHLEQPVVDPALYTQWAVHARASSQVKVILDGEGGDEALAGYRNYRIAFAANLLRSGRVLSLARELWGTFRNMKGELRGIPQILFYALGPRLKSMFFAFSRRDVTKEVDGIGSEEIREIVSRVFSSDIGEILEVFIAASSLPHLLRYEDRCSMAHSIEGRVPFTDYRIINLTYSIPATFLMHRGWTKWLLRLAMQEILPEEILWRGDKLGYATPRWRAREELWQEWSRWYPSGFRDGLADARVEAVTSRRLSAG